MIGEIWKNKTALILVVFLVALLAGIRMFETTLFYDPFLDFFKSDYQNAPLPEYQSVKLFLGLSSRYFINSLLSVAIIYLVFKELPMLLLAAILYGLFYVVLITAFFLVLSFSEQSDYLLLFYVRRFLIQPLFLVIFLPAFYYQKKTNK